MSTFMDAMNFRHACKRFDPDRGIPADAFDTLLEAVRLSPSSFGMEPWRLIVVRSKSLRETLRPLCWNQAQITEASELILFTTDNDAVRGATPYVKAMFDRRGLDAEATERYVGVYAAYTDALASRGRLEDWTAKQCYLAAANLMTCAAAMGIDSCPLEGFEREKVEAALALAPGRTLALMVALGYRAGEQSVRARLQTDEIVTYR